jgi:DNA-binding NarL/FixJ family response regulator
VPDRMGRLRVLVVDDHLVIRRELRRLIVEAGAEVVAEAATVTAAVREAETHQPDMILLDLSLPDGHALDVMPAFRRSAPHALVVVLTASQAEADIRKALEMGAAGYLTKDLSANAVVAAITQAAAGLTPVTGRAVTALLSGSSTRKEVAEAAVGRLSARERQVLALLAEGESASEVAERIGISVRTVEGHARSILNRLGARNRAEAVRIFMEAGGSPST